MSELNKYIERLLTTIAKSENILEYKFDFGETLKGDGYLGVINFIKIEGKTDSGKAKVLNLVIKSAPTSDKLRKQAPIRVVFESEIYMYKTILPVFLKFHSANGAKMPLFGIPKCYLTSSDNLNELLILENLKSLGYALWDRKIPMTEDHVKLVFTEYGRLHAFSLAVRNQNSQLFETLAKSMHDPFRIFLEQTNILSVIKTKCEHAQKSLDPQIDKKAIQLFKQFTDGLDTIIPTFYADISDTYSVILHGDCWCNNMMFKYEDSKKPSIPTSIRLLDWQLSRIGPPVFDLSYFFYACSSKEILDKLNYYLHVYYKNLSSYIKQLGSDPAIVFPFSALENQWKKHSKFGLFMAVIIVNIMLSDEEEVQDLSDFAEKDRDFTDSFVYETSNSDSYNKRIRDIILHFVENEFL